MKELGNPAVILAIVAFLLILLSFWKPTWPMLNIAVLLLAIALFVHVLAAGGKP